MKKRLAEMNMTQYELAAQVGTNSNYIYLIMIGERSGKSFIPKLAQVLGIELHELSRTA
nr:helix-turn-helix transcriptional regulator [Paenibacillus melissococcoides]